MDTVKEFILCDCGNPEHLLLWQYFPDEDDPRMYHLYVEVHLAPVAGFFRRLWRGLRYAFGYRCKYGDFDEILLNVDSASKLKEFIENYLDAYPAANGGKNGQRR